MREEGRTQWQSPYLAGDPRFNSQYCHFKKRKEKLKKKQKQKSLKKRMKLDEWEFAMWRKEI